MELIFLNLCPNRQKTTSLCVTKTSSNPKLCWTSLTLEIPSPWLFFFFLHECAKPRLIPVMHRNPCTVHCPQPELFHLLYKSQAQKPPNLLPSSPFISLFSPSLNQRCMELIVYSNLTLSQDRVALKRELSLFLFWGRDVEVGQCGARFFMLQFTAHKCHSHIFWHLLVCTQVTHEMSLMYLNHFTWKFKWDIWLKLIFIASYSQFSATPENFTLFSFVLL